MKRSETLKVLRACCIAAAKLLEVWRSTPRKNQDYCNVAMTFESENDPEAIDMVEFQIPWETLEGGISLEQMIYEIFSSCWIPPAGSKELGSDIPADRVLN